MRSARCAPLVSHTSIPDGAATIQGLLVVDRKANGNGPRDALTGQSVCSHRSVSGKKAGRPQAAPTKASIDIPEFASNGNLPLEQEEGTP
ncbi:hypothetical protein BHE74_00024376 [Ensete ventricosum]|nr:hypothetical protein GW17_00008936 [Ensete ventricosum]RWW68124.1 hypothetical protein BHE74_00024376 [Ensete ventricosum]RZS09811.1 hypothetical protein BHM03_00040933 [Ensete ventricosum]